MKRLIVFVAALCMLFSVSCSSSLAVEQTDTLDSKTQETEVKSATVEKEKNTEPIVLPEGFSAGYGRRVVNPDQGTSLGGWPSAAQRLSGSIVDDIKLTCTALSDGEKIFFLFSTDALAVSDALFNKIASLAEKNHGVPVENVIVNATHSHSAPASYISGLPGVAKYNKKLYPAVEEVMEEALRDLAPATVFAGRGYTENLNYVRRYVTIDGTKYLGGTAMGLADPDQARHETEADNQMQVLRFEREGKKDIVLCNWQCHPTTMSSEFGTTVSADWVGPFRDAVEKDLDVLFSYHQGAAGDLVPSSRIRGEKGNGDYNKHGQALAEVAKKALSEAKRVETAPFESVRSDFVATHSEAYKSKSGTKSKTDTLHLTVLSIGDVSFVSAPCEWHDTCGQIVKNNTPYQMTFVCAYSNGSKSYIPSELAFQNGGYEVSSCHFVSGTGEAIAREHLRLLQELKNN